MLRQHISPVADWVTYVTLKNRSRCVVLICYIGIYKMITVLHHKYELNAYLKVQCLFFFKWSHSEELSWKRLLVYLQQPCKHKDNANPFFNTTVCLSGMTGCLHYFMLQKNIVAKKYFLQHTVFVAFFLLISFFQYCYEMLTMPLYGLLYIGYAYRKSMVVDIFYSTFWPWKITVKVKGQGH